MRESRHIVTGHQGFVKAISAYPGIRLLAVEDGAWLQLKAGEKMDTLLSRFPHIDLVYAQNDRMAAGAYAAAAREGREKDMRFIGIDALPGKDYGVEKVLAGELDATLDVYKRQWVKGAKWWSAMIRIHIIW